MKACIIVTSIFVLFQLFKYDLYIIANAKSFGLGIMLGLLDLLVCAVYAIIFVISTFGAVIHAIRNLNTEKWKSFVPVFIYASVAFCVFIIPMTDFYTNLNYEMNKNDRMKIVEMVENGTISEYRINMYEYMVPYRLTSSTGTIFVQGEKGVLKIMFYVHNGRLRDKVLVYVSDDSGINAMDFNFGTIPSGNLKKMDDCWYSATIK